MRIGWIEKLLDFLVCHFWILVNKKCFIPMKISHKLCDRMDGTQFWCFSRFPEISLLCVILYYTEFMNYSYITFLSHDVRIFTIEYCIILCFCQSIEWKITKSDRKGTGMFFLNLSWANTFMWTLEKNNLKIEPFFKHKTLIQNNRNEL